MCKSDTLKNSTANQQNKQIQQSIIPLTPWTELSAYDKQHLLSLRYLMNLSPANKKKVGATIGLESFTLANGFNNMFHNVFDNKCEDIYGETIPFVIHAEEEAIIKILKHTSSIDIHDAFGLTKNQVLQQATLYSSYSPCVNCSKLIAQSGIKRVIFLEKHYENFDNVKFSPYEFFIQMGIEVIHTQILNE